VVPEPSANHLRKGQAAAPSNHAVAARSIKAIRFDIGGRRCKEEFVDALYAAMDNGAAPATAFNIDTAWQSGHPTARIGSEFGYSMRKLGGRETLAGAANRKSAATVGGTCCQALLAIAHDDVAANFADQIDCCRRIGAIGCDVSGADDAIGRDFQQSSLI